MPQLKFGLALLLWLAACHLGCASSGVDVSTAFDPLTRFPAQASYLWNDAANKLPDDPRLNQMEIDSLIRQAAGEEFAAHGYRLSASGSANYRLSYDLTIHSWYGPDNSSSVASLSLWLAEAASKRRVWIGYMRAEILVGLTREERVKRMREAMSRLLENFPPLQRGD